MQERYDPFENDILRFYTDDVEKAKISEYEIATLLKLCEQPKGNAFQQLQLFRKLCPKLIAHSLLQQKVLEGYTKTFDRIKQLSACKQNMRWAPEEDELLIDAVASGKQSLFETSLAFGRTPAAIKTRVSYLVGIKRISANVAGSFVGYLNGEHVEGTISGTVTKK